MSKDDKRTGAEKLEQAGKKLDVLNHVAAHHEAAKAAGPHEKEPKVGANADHDGPDRIYTSPHNVKFKSKRKKRKWRKILVSAVMIGAAGTAGYMGLVQDAYERDNTIEWTGHHAENLVNSVVELAEDVTNGSIDIVNDARQALADLDDMGEVPEKISPVSWGTDEVNEAPRTLAERYRDSVKAPSGYNTFMDIRFNAQLDSKSVIDGYEGVSTSADIYPIALSNLPDGMDPLIDALKASPDHSAEDLALDFVNNGGLENLPEDTNDATRATIQAAVIYSLKIGGFDAEADVAYANMMDGYEDSRDFKGFQTKSITPLMPTQDFENNHAHDPLGIMHGATHSFPRDQVDGPIEGAGQHQIRQEAYDNMARGILNAFGEISAPVYLSNQSAIDAVLGGTTAEPSNGEVFSNPLLNGEEAVFINYDDLSIPEGNAPRIMAEQYTDTHKNLSEASSVVSEMSFRIYTDTLQEKVLTGTLNPNHPAYSYAVTATINFAIDVSDEVRDSSADVVSNSSADFSDRFDRMFDKAMDKIDQNSRVFRRGVLGYIPLPE